HRVARHAARAARRPGARETPARVGGRARVRDPRGGQALPHGHRAAPRARRDQARAARTLRPHHRGRAGLGRVRRRARGRGPPRRLPHHRGAQGAGRGRHPGHPHREADAVIALRRSLRELSKADEARLFVRGRDADPEVERAVAAIIADVRARGDDALRDLARRFDRVDLNALEVPRDACDAALATLNGEVRAALEQAAAAIAAFHRAQLPPPLDIEVRPGVRLGRRAEPLRRAGVYAPGGRAAYPSSVLMGVVPAKVAGVDEVVVCSPPGPDGLPHPVVLAACALAGADRVFALGGAGAIVALAYGTASVPRVDRIVGPGNAYVNEAKRQVAGSVGIDSPAGPSELLVVADASADPETVALELLAQAEHDPDAAVAVVATDEA